MPGLHKCYDGRLGSKGWKGRLRCPPALRVVSRALSRAFTRSLALGLSILSCFFPYFLQPPPPLSARLSALSVRLPASLSLGRSLSLKHPCCFPFLSRRPFPRCFPFLSRRPFPRCFLVLSRRPFPRCFLFLSRRPFPRCFPFLSRRPLPRCFLFLSRRPFPCVLPPQDLWSRVYNESEKSRVQSLGHEREQHLPSAIARVLHHPCTNTTSPI